MRTNQNSARRVLLVVLLTIQGLLVVQSRPYEEITSASPREEPLQVNEASSINQTGPPFTREEKELLVAKLLSNPKMKPRLKYQRISVLSVKPAADHFGANAVGVRVASVVLFNYSSGKASSLLVNSESGEILSERLLKGRPQPSEEEIQEASKIIREDPALGRMLDADSLLEGGFVVDDPNGKTINHRFIQMHLLTSDRRVLRRLIVVDLTSRKIAAVKIQQVEKY